MHGGVQSQDLRRAGAFAGPSPGAQTPAPGLQVGHAWKMQEKELAATTASTGACYQLQPEQHPAAAREGGGTSTALPPDPQC